MTEVKSSPRVYQRIVGGEYPLTAAQADLWRKSWDDDASIAVALEKFAGDKNEALWLGFGRNAVGVALDVCGIDKEAALSLAAYNCVAVAKKIASRTRKWNFYSLDGKLGPEPKSYSSAAKKSQAVFTTVYYGSPAVETRLLVLNNAFRKEGRSPWVIEDRVMAFPTALTSKEDGLRCDFAIYSFRKHFPVPDGAMLLACSTRAKDQLALFLAKKKFAAPSAATRAALERKVDAKLKRGAWAATLPAVDDEKNNGLPESVKSEAGLDEIHDQLESDYVQGSAASAALAGFLATTGARKAVQSQSSMAIRVVKSPLADACGVGVPALAHDRDARRALLREKGIFLPVHWPRHDLFPLSDADRTWFDRELTIPTLAHFSDEDERYLRDALRLVFP